MSLNRSPVLEPLASAAGAAAGGDSFLGCCTAGRSLLLPREDGFVAKTWLLRLFWRRVDPEDLGLSER